jgi:hypothetical protein
MGRAGPDQPQSLTAQSAGAAGADPTSGARRTVSLPRPGPWAADVGVIAGYLLVAVLVTGPLWLHRDRMVVAHNDQMLFEWMLAWAAHAVTHLENPLYSTQLGAPDGVNLMANTSVLGLGVPLTPVTLLFGSQTSFLVALVLSLAGTAAAWYLFLIRRIVRSRVAAAVGGLFCGFAPGMISQASGHLHMIAQFLVPAILWFVFHPAAHRVVRRGVLLGLLVAYQLFLGEEVLAFLVLAAGLFAAGYAVASPAQARRFARPLLGRLAVGALTALVLLAYPLWFQFRGPGHYRGLPFEVDRYMLDLASFATMARQSLAGSDAVTGRLAPNATEENSFFGLALLVLCAVIVAWQWRRPEVRSLALCAVVFAALALGPTIQIWGERTDLPGPYRLVAQAPLLDLAVPARFPLILIPVVAILLAISLDEVFRASPAVPGLPVRLLWTGAVVAVLLPTAPLPMRTVPVWPVPEFVASGEWRLYVPPGRTLVPVPPTSGEEAIAGMFWSARTGLEFTVPGGYFIGPSGPDDPRARWGSPERPTAALLAEVARTGQVPEITDEQRRQAIEDLRYWKAAVVVQGGLHNGYPVKETVDRLLGPGEQRSDAWVWDVRHLVD